MRVNQYSWKFMRPRQIIATITILLIVPMRLALAGYITPNTGVNWTLDSLLVYSGGTLTGAYPNYILADTLTVSQNDRLTIRAGSIISVAQGTGKGFTIFGVLRAIGTPGDTIVVNGVVATPGSHRGFRFEDSAVDSACVLSYCRIQDAVEAVHCLNTSPTITNSFFTNNSSNGVRCFAASPIIRFCTFVENRRNAITANLGSSPRIENNIFARNNSENTSPRNQISIGPQGVNNPIIRNNEVYNMNYFRTGAISLVNVESAGSCAALVEGNYLHDNSFGILSQGVNMTPMIRYNRIENSRINPDPFVAGSGISIQVGGPTNAPIITGNIIKDNYWGITLVSGSGLTNSPRANIGNLSNADTSDNGWNVFENNNNGGTIYQLYNNGTQDITAQNNYWGSNDSITVESWITHRPDSAVFGLVNYRPIRSLVSVEQQERTPHLFQLSQNYPNPFNPKTVIQFRVGSREWVSLRVFDMLGREAVILVNDVKEPGEHTVTFDASRLASGVYLYRLETRGLGETRKLILMK